MKRMLSVALAVIGMLAWDSGSAAQSRLATVGPSQGTMILIGGGNRDSDIIKRIVDLAGGPGAPILVIPTAAGEANYDESFGALRRFREAGSKNVKLLHTYDRGVADSEAFVASIKQARAVYFAGGRHWRLADAYLDTRTHREVQAVLARGGVVAGTSAGATMLGSFLIRGDTKGAEILVGDHTKGFGFLRNVTVDQHLLRRNRQFDMLAVIDAHPHLLGLGLDEDTAIVVQQDEFEVIGRSYVAVYDRERHIPPNGLFYFLAEGDRYNLATREPTRQTPTNAPLDRVTRRPGAR